MIFDKNKLKYQLIDPKAPTESNFDLFTQAFDKWSETWEEAYMAYWNSTDIFSDQFTRQTSQGILTYNGDVIGTLAFDTKDMNLSSTRKDSYFRMWNDLSYHKLKKETSTGSVLVCSWFTLTKGWRKETHGIDFKKLLVAIGVKEFSFSNESTMCGTMVHVGGLQEVCYNHNSKVIEKNTKEKGLPVDLMMWKKEDILTMEYPYYAEIINSLFLDRNQKESELSA